MDRIERQISTVFFLPIFTATGMTAQRGEQIGSNRVEVPSRIMNACPHRTGDPTLKLPQGDLTAAKRETTCGRVATRLLALPFQISPVAFSSFSRDRSTRALLPSTSDRAGEPERPVNISTATRVPNEGNAALDRAFRDDGAVLLRYLGRHVGPEAAPDLMQEVFLRAVGSEQRNRLANPAAFLQRIARNLLINRAVSSRRNKIVLLPLLEEHDLASPPEQELGMEAADLLRLYNRAVMGLSEKTRRVFLMHRVEELSYREIHQRLGISVATVEYHMMKALAHIAQVVDPIDE